MGSNRLLKSKVNSLEEDKTTYYLFIFLAHLCMRPTPHQCIRQKANQIFLGCLLIKYLQSRKYKNPQSPQLSPEASKVWADFNSKKVTGSWVDPHCLSRCSPRALDLEPQPHPDLLRASRLTVTTQVPTWEGVLGRVREVKREKLLEAVDLWKPRPSNWQGSLWNQWKFSTLSSPPLKKPMSDNPRPPPKSLDLWP